MVTLNPSAVDVGTIQTVQILSHKTGGVSDYAGVMPRNRDVIEEQVALRIPPDSEQIRIESNLLTLTAASGPDKKAGNRAASLRA